MWLIHKLLLRKLSGNFETIYNKDNNMTLYVVIQSISTIVGKYLVYLLLTLITKTLCVVIGWDTT